MNQSKEKKIKVVVELDKIIVNKGVPRIGVNRRGVRKGIRAFVHKIHLREDLMVSDGIFYRLHVPSGVDYVPVLITPLPTKKK